MSGTVSSPWIADYLINIAEIYGCNLSSVPIQVKPGKKVQLLQFLTFRQFVEDDCIWAIVSDKHQQIPVRFSRHAIAEYDRDNPPDSQSKRLTQQRCAVVTIRSFKPTFQRIPTGQVGKMTVKETLALNVDSVRIVGAAGEPEFGSPRVLDTHSDINEWMEGLRASDGSGNILKLRKEKKLAEERGENSVTEEVTAHERRGFWSGQHIDVILSENHAMLPDRKAQADQDGWRESIAKKPIQFYKRPTGNDVTAFRPAPTGPSRNNGNMAPPVKQIVKSRKGPLDLDSSPVITLGADNDSPARSGRQTTPSEWPASPEGSRIHFSLSRDAADSEKLPISPPSTPPLLTPAASRHSVGTPEPTANHNPQGFPATVQQKRPSNPELRSLGTPTSPQGHRRSLPPSPSNPAFPPAVVTTSLTNMATSLPSEDVGPSMPHARRVPPPFVKNAKLACGEVLVPGSDSGGPGTQSLSNESSSPVGRRATPAASRGHESTSMIMNSGSERVDNVRDRRSPIQEAGPSQERNNAQLDDLSRMAVNGSCEEQPHGNGVHTRYADGHNAVEPVLPGQQPYEPLPPSSPPIHSQAPSWQRSTILVEETPVMEVSSTHETAPFPPTSTAKRTRSPSPSPMRSKRPRLVSREPGATPKRVFDPELLQIGIEVDLSGYDDEPPPCPWEKGMSRLNFRPPTHPLLITNSKLGEIWRSVCKYRGWCEK